MTDTIYSNDTNKIKMIDLQNKTHKEDILIVDDTPENLRFLSTILMSEGYNTRKALCGQMALTAV